MAKQELPPCNLGIAKRQDNHEFVLVAEAVLPMQFQLPIDLRTILRTARRFAPQLWHEVSIEIIEPEPRRLIDPDGNPIVSPNGHSDGE
jgi:hypothetical protein